MATVDSSVAGSVERVQELTEHLDAVADPGTRAIAEELITAVVQMYGAGLERMIELIAELGPDVDAAAIRDAFAGDDLVASLLLIHDLHPVSVEQRVAQALDRVRPYMESHGGDVELLGIDDGVARLRLQGTCSSCRASSETLELAVRQALEELCPDLAGMDVEGIAPGPELAGFPGVAMPIDGGDGGTPWHDVDGLEELGEGRLVTIGVGDAALLIANVEGTLLAYRDRCASCAAGFAGAALAAGTISCPACGHGFVLTRAGRSIDDDLQLEPVPLLRLGARVQVALEAR